MSDWLTCITYYQTCSEYNIWRKRKVLLHYISIFLRKSFFSDEVLPFWYVGNDTNTTRSLRYDRNETFISLLIGIYIKRMRRSFIWRPNCGSSYHTGTGNLLASLLLYRNTNLQPLSPPPNRSFKMLKRIDFKMLFNILNNIHLLIANTNGRVTNVSSEFIVFSFSICKMFKEIFQKMWSSKGKVNM